MKNLLLTTISILFINSLFAQSKVTGTVLNAAGEPIPFATVVLNSAADSAMVKGAITNDDGGFLFEKVADGRYWVKTAFVGKKEGATEVFAISGSDVQMPDITMEDVSNELDAVGVSAVRPLLEVKADRTVFNVEGSINAQGSNGLELLRKAPGVVIDNDENVMLAGKSGVRIFIDGRPSPLSGEDLANYLKSLNSAQIDRVEIITNPSAKYDAEGNAGIIDIKLKKDKNLGGNATATAGYSQGRKARGNAGLSANYRNKKTNLYGSYHFSDGKHWNFMNFYRELLIVDTIPTIPDTTLVGYDQKNVFVYRPQTHSFKAGLDYFIDSANTLGFNVSGLVSQTHTDSESETLIAPVGQEEIDQILDAGSEKDADNSTYDVNVNYTHEKKGKTISLDANYALFRNRGKELQPNTYLTPDGDTLLQRDFFQRTPTNIDIATVKGDFERSLGGGQFAVGAKVAYIKTDNTFDFFNVINGENILDAERSNRFEYIENINAVYSSFSRKIKQYDLYLGLRVEQTNSKGTLTGLQEETNDTSYVDFFPSSGVTYTSKNFENSVRLNYSRRVDRPNYQNLNPFEWKLDELTFMRGNPFLEPQFTNSFEMTYTYKFRYSAAFGFSHTKDLMTRLTDADTARQGSAFLGWFNVGKQYTYSLTLSAAFSPTKWWSSYTNLSAYRIQNKGEKGEGGLDVIDIDANAVNIYSQHVFSLPKNFKFEISGWYGSPAIWGGTFHTDGMWSLDAGLQLSFLKDRASVKVSVNDIFESSNWSGYSDYGSIYYEGEGNHDSRKFNLNLTYMFGNQNVKSRKRDDANKEESKRAGGGGGR